MNTDGFTVGEEKEVWAGIRIFELAKQNGGVRHYVWSSLDYASKVSRRWSLFSHSVKGPDIPHTRAVKIGNYDPRYRCEHYDGKARVADWMRSQPSDIGVGGMAWSVVTSGPYMDMLFNVRAFSKRRTRACF